MFGKLEISPVLSNLGFLFQISGFFILPSIAYAFYINEIDAAIGLLIADIVFLCLGFAFNVFCERKTLNMKQSCLLLVLFYVISPLINVIPLLYVRIFEGSIIDQLLNSWFETVSATTTSGLTLMEGMTVPHSIMLARGMNEWVGGIGIIFILLAFFYPSKSLLHYSKAMGMENLSVSYRDSFINVLLIYLVYTGFFSAILMVTGLDPFTAFHTTLTVLSTTGLTSVSVLTLPIIAIVTVTIMMLFSAFSFTFHLNLFSCLREIDWRSIFTRNRNEKQRNQNVFMHFVSNVKRAFSKVKWRKLLSTEFKLYIIFLFFFCIMFWFTSGLSPFNAVFHVIDMSSSCGLGLIPFNDLGELAKVMTVVIMFIGPMSFSVGGGIRVLRVHILAKAFLAIPKMFLTGEIPKIQLEGDDIDTTDFILHAMIVLLFLALTLIGAIVFTAYNYTFIDGLIESVSAITTMGDSPHLLTPSLAAVPKILISVLEILGRIEIIPILIAFSREIERKREYYRII